ncbi:hypothetical protein L6164_020855 [Bauhinia variegata]|uniref:Uncharacterized protein n=1 Tax=Bauhinia variegata TaxID=167791 RepID=A0ACB9N1H6_BAUVA|nr:hypothetical protein L6164_020855 [Bauhinia variegata]
MHLCSLLSSALRLSPAILTNFPSFRCTLTEQKENTINYLCARSDTNTSTVDGDSDGDANRYVTSATTGHLSLLFLLKQFQLRVLGASEESGCIPTL